MNALIGPIHVQQLVRATRAANEAQVAANEWDATYGITQALPMDQP